MGSDFCLSASGGHNDFWIATPPWNQFHGGDIFSSWLPCRFFHSSNSRRPSSLSKNARISGSRQRARASSSWRGSPDCSFGSFMVSRPLLQRLTRPFSFYCVAVFCQNCIMSGGKPQSFPHCGRCFCENQQMHKNGSKKLFHICAAFRRGKTAPCAARRTFSHRVDSTPQIRYDFTKKKKKRVESQTSRGRPLWGGSRKFPARQG